MGLLFVGEYFFAQLCTSMYTPSQKTLAAAITLIYASRVIDIRHGHCPTCSDNPYRKFISTRILLDSFLESMNVSVKPEDDGESGIDIRRGHCPTCVR